MTDQEIFDRVSAHLLQQNKPAMEGGKCCYRTSEGLSCAVGCLIAPEVYSEGLEGQGVVALDLRAALRDSGIEPTYKTITLLSDLQNLHDATPPQDWPAELPKIAAHHGLTMKPTRIPCP
jgi:hypothetical protein